MQLFPSGFMCTPSGTVGDLHIYNTDAHRNYVGYRFDGSATAIELKNCRAYANRTYGLMDNTAAVTYSYCHFYANNLATGVSTDVTGTPGPIDGGIIWRWTRRRTCADSCATRRGSPSPTTTRD